MVETIAIIAAVLFLGLAAFQVALLMGAPLGNHVYGGRVANDDGTLPIKFRVASGVAAFLLVAFAWVILVRAGIMTSRLSDQAVTVLSWMVVAYMALNTAANLASKDPIERYLFGGITIALVVLCAMVAAAGPS